MWLQACLNGSRTLTDHSAVPLSPGDLAADASRVVAAGAVALHFHPRDEAGRESLAAEHVAAALTAVREICPGIAVGISTAADIEPDVAQRLAAIEAWTVLPDYASVNFAEPHIEQVIAVLAKRGIGLEAGISTPEDARHLLALPNVTWLRLLLEPPETDPVQASAVVDEIEAVLAGALPEVPRLLHGTDGAVWSLLKRAAYSGYASRVGLEDTLRLPTGEFVPGNVALVQAARALV